MTRKLALLAAAIAFCGLASVAQAQGSGGTESSSTVTAGGPGSGSSMRGRAMRSQRAMRPATRMAMRGTGRSGTHVFSQLLAYQGGGAVYERGADGSLRPVN